MSEQTFGIALWVWLLGAPLVFAFIDMGRTASSSSRTTRYDTPTTTRADMATSVR